MVYKDDGVQCYRKSFCFRFFDFTNLFIPLRLGLGMVPVVPVNILVFLPPTSGRVDTVSQVVLCDLVKIPQILCDIHVPLCPCLRRRRTI